jgi:hypothetical protein
MQLLTPDSQVLEPQHSRGRFRMLWGGHRRGARLRPSPPGEDGHHHEGSDRRDDDLHAVRDGSPGRTTGADPREHEPKNQAHAQVASTSVFADALTLPALEAGQSRSPAAWWPPAMASLNSNGTLSA